MAGPGTQIELRSFPESVHSLVAAETHMGTNVEIILQRHIHSVWAWTEENFREATALVWSSPRGAVQNQTRQV